MLHRGVHFSTCSMRQLTTIVRISCHVSRASLRSSELRTCLFNVNSIRYVRTRSGGAASGSGEGKEQHEEQEKKEEKEEQEGGEKKEQQQKKVDPAMARKLRMYVLAVGGISFVTSFILMSQMIKDGTGFPEGVDMEVLNREGIDFPAFTKKYLRVGEVKKIVFLPAVQKAVAVLHDGAVVDGRAVPDHRVVVSYSKSAQELWADIRKEEAELGIPLQNGVQLQLHQGMTTLKMVELLLGILIMVWLGSQYGRLLRKRILEQKAKQGK